MRQLFFKITASIMAFVVLFSTMSFTINMHYCGDTLVDFSVFKQAKTCGMEVDQSTPVSTNSFAEKGCCTDKHITVKGQDELKNTSFDKLTFSQQQFIVSFVYAYINNFEGFNDNQDLFSEYPPPLIVKNIYKLDETYLI